MKEEEYDTYEEAFGADMTVAGRVKKHKTAVIEPNVFFVGKSRDLITIEKDSYIRSGAVIYPGCHLAAKVSIGHNAVLRDHVTIGRHTYIGNLTVVENDAKIGEHTGIHSQCHITAGMKIGNYTFLAPCVVSGNDRRIAFRRRDHGRFLNAPKVGNSVRIGLGANILPEVKIGDGAVIGVGAVVTKDVEPYTIVMGIPAKQTGKVDALGQNDITLCDECELPAV